MNLDYYKNFVTIVDVGTISAAAERLLIAQPALSKQLQALESYYGAPLVVRKPRHIELTDAGKILYEKVRSICYLEEAAQKEIDAAVLGNRGVLRLGITPCSPDRLIEMLLMDFHKQYPDVTYEIFERNSNVLVDLISEGLVEAVILRSNMHLPPTMKEVLSLGEKIMVYCHREHPLLSEDPDADIPVQKLRDVPLSITNGLKNTLIRACNNAGFEPRIESVCSSRAASIMWCSDRQTAAVIVSPEPFDQDVYCCRRIEGEGFETGRFLAVSAERRISAVTRTFLEFCLDHPLTGFEKYLL